MKSADVICLAIPVDPAPAFHLAEFLFPVFMWTSTAPQIMSITNRHQGIFTFLLFCHIHHPPRKTAGTFYALQISI